MQPNLINVWGLLPLYVLSSYPERNKDLGYYRRGKQVDRTIYVQLEVSAFWF